MLFPGVQIAQLKPVIHSNNHKQINVICWVTKILDKKKTRGVMQDTTQTTELVCIPTTSYKKIRK